MFYYPRNWVNILSTRFWGMAQLSTMTTTPGKMLVVGSRPERMMTRAKSKGKGCVWGTINEIEIQNKITPNDKFKGKFLPARFRPISMHGSPCLEWPKFLSPHVTLNPVSSINLSCLAVFLWPKSIYAWVYTISYWVNPVPFERLTRLYI